MYAAKPLVGVLSGAATHTVTRVGVKAAIARVAETGAQLPAALVGIKASVAVPVGPATHLASRIGTSRAIAGARGSLLTAIPPASQTHSGAIAITAAHVGSLAIRSAHTLGMSL